MRNANLCPGLWRAATRCQPAPDPCGRLSSDARVTSTISAIERELVIEGFVRRYDTGATDDGLPPGEGMFLACSFWLADAYQMVGRQADAVKLFERLVALCNDVGLLSEEYDVSRRRLVGNFPQAFSHIALVNTAHNLTHAEKPSEHRSGRKAIANAIEARGRRAIAIKADVSDEDQVKSMFDRVIDHFGTLHIQNAAWTAKSPWRQASWSS